MRNFNKICSFALLFLALSSFNAYADLENESTTPTLLSGEENVQIIEEPPPAPAPVASPTPLTGEPTLIDPAASQPVPVITTTPSVEASPPLTAPPAVDLSPAIAPPLQSISDPAVVSQLQKERDKKDSEDAPVEIPSFDKSLMFDEAKVNELRIAYEKYKQRFANNTPVTDDDPKVEEILTRIVSQEELQVAPPGIFLNSTLYRAADNATAWINGRKFELGAKFANIRLVSVTPSSAQIEWTSAGYNFDFTAWEEIFPQVGNDNPEILSKLPPSKRMIRVDSKAKSIYATLRPNQHLDLGQKNIREGKPPEPVATTNPVEGQLPAMPGEPEVYAPKSLTERISDAAAPIDGSESIISANQSGMAIFSLASDGHYQVPAMLDGADITFKVDTGATVTIISSDDAKKIGIDTAALDYRYTGKIADGSTMKAAEAVIKEFKVKDMVFNNVTVFVAQGNFAEPLLGMSFFSKLKKFSFENDTLTIVQ